MKRYSLNIALHIILIALCSAGVYVLVQKQLWFSTLVVVLIGISIGVHLYNMQMRHIGMMQRFINSIRFNDMTQSFPANVKNKMMREFARELSDVLKLLQTRMLEEEVRHQYYENLLNKVDTAVLVTEMNRKIEWMNQAAVTLLGQLPHLPDIIPALPDNETQVIRLERNGMVQEMAVSSTLFSAQGKNRLLISLKNIHSVLERNEMEAWQKLIRVLTHEIMNSITPIISLSETLSERSIPPEIEEKEYKVMLQAMQTIHRRSKGLLEFVENYRRLTRIPAPICSPIRISELFADLRKLLLEEGIHFETPDRDIVLSIDRSLIEQVLINLIKNAGEACAGRTDARIEVKATAKKQDRQVAITIKDNGVGILPDVMDKIFVPFFTTKASGSGIGLSLCKQIMNLHKGSIRVQSEVGVGSCFELCFPG